MFCTRCGKELRAQDCFCSQCGHAADPDAPARVKPRLTRDMAHKRIAGVAAGLARYFDVDTVLVRILMVVLVFWGGMGLVFYIAGWIAMPKDTNPRPVPANAPEPAAAR